MNSPGAANLRRSRPAGARTTCCLLAMAVCLAACASAQAQEAGPPAAGPVTQPPAGATLADAQSHFYNGRYEEAAALALAVRAFDGPRPASDELRSSALLFQLKALLEGHPKKADV